MDAPAARPIEALPERGEPRLACCEVCRHEHVCYVADRPSPATLAPAWNAYHVCLGCLMRAANPDGWSTCVECAYAG